MRRAGRAGQHVLSNGASPCVTVALTGQGELQHGFEAFRNHCSDSEILSAAWLNTETFDGGKLRLVAQLRQVNAIRIVAVSVVKWVLLNGKMTL